MFRRLLLIMVALVCAAAQAGTARAQAVQPDLAKLTTEAQGWLADLIRIDTANPPGNELAAAKYVAGILQKEGIGNEVLELAPGRGIVIGRLQAAPLPNAANALLLVSHLDTAAVDAGKWTVNPFGAVVRDGYLYGSGVLDDKAMLAANLATIVGMKRSTAPLDRDIIFLATADEEQRGPASVKFVIEKYWDKIACAYAINQGGRVMVKDGNVQYVGIETSEKVPYNFAVTVKGAPGDASIPLPDNAVVHLSTALAKIGAYQPAPDLSLTMLKFFAELSKVEDAETAGLMRELGQPERAEFAVRHLTHESPIWNAMLRDTISPTMVRGGIDDAMLPSEAIANLSIFLIPGHVVDAVVAQIEKAVNDPQVDFQRAANSGEYAPPSSTANALYKSIAQTSAQEFPDALSLPVLGMEATDSNQLRLRKIPVYGVFPFPLTEADELRRHGDNERIPLESFRSGVAFLYRVVNDFATEKWESGSYTFP